MNSSDIETTAFRQILLLPLTLTGFRKDVAAEVHEIAAGLDGRSGWSEVTDHLAHLPDASDKATAYAEFVYFHAYIQDFLYDRPDPTANGRGERPLRLFRRRDPGRFEVRVNVEGRALGESEVVAVDITLPIVQMKLYFFELGIVILALEVALEKDPKVRINGVERPMSLAHAQALQNALRRIYPPYFLDDAIASDDVAKIPEYPASLTWSHGKNNERCKPSEWIAHVEKYRRNPIDPVWKNILSPLYIEERSTESGRRWRQIIDERIPSMIFISMRGPTVIERSDFVRLCFMDGPNRGYPYAEAFLNGFEQNCYDRYWYGTEGTRYMFSGYSMVIIGTGDPEKPTDFCHTVLPTHFRRHYFQIGLLIQLQFAALLSLSHRVSEAVRHKKRDDAEFRRTMLEIEEAVLLFEQRYWFTQVSNQLQAREIYGLWLEKTGVTEIYSEVREQVHAANAYLDAREQERQTRAATRLSVVATFGVIVGASLAFLGMNVLVSADLLAAFGVPKDLASVPPSAITGLSGVQRMLAAHLAVVFVVVTIFSGLGRLLVGRYSDPSVPKEKAGQANSITSRLNRDLIYLATGSFLLFVLFASAAR